MGLHKNSERGKCFVKVALEPFLIPLLKAWGVELTEDVTGCDPDCVLYRKGIRYFDDGKRTEPFEECPINIIADSAENQVRCT